MRRGSALALLGVMSVGVLPAVASAAAPRVSATPSTVRFGHQQTISGHQWGVNEFCRRTVRVQLIGAQNQFDIGTARVRDNGTFTRVWTPRRSKVGAGSWKARVTQRCESGKDGSAIFVRRSVPIRIR